MIRSILILLVLAGRPVYGESSADLPLSHPIYPLLDRFENIGLFDEPLHGIRPYPIGYVTQLCEIALRSRHLVSSERAEAERFLEAYSASNSQGLKSGRIYSYTDSILQIHIRPAMSQSFLSVGGDEGESVSETLVGASVQGRYHGILSFSVQHFEGREWSSVARSSATDVRYSPKEELQIKGKTVDFRESRFQLRADLPWFSIDVGKQSFDWGPSRESNLTLNGSGPSYIHARARFTHKAVTFDHMFAALRTPPEDQTWSTLTISNGHRRVLEAPKRLVAHRLELALSHKLRIGLHETVVFGDRGFEPAYAVPIAPLLGAQSYAGDTDNLTLGADVVFRPTAGISLYGALFFDDLQKFSPGAFSNQVGIQIGGHWSNPFGLQAVDLRTEFVHIEPYTYAHNFDINSYTHFRDVLGHALGPNADRLHFETTWWASRQIRFQGSFQRTREGENYQQGGDLINVGGNAFQGRRPDDSPQREFLAGDQTRSIDVFGSLSLVPAPTFEIALTYRYRSRRITPAIGGGSSSTSSHMVGVSARLNTL